MDDMYTRGYGTMHNEIIRYVASTILVTMSIYADPMTEIEIEGEVDCEDIKYVPEALQYLQEKGLLSHHTGYDGGRDLYLVPADVEEEVHRVCICAIADNINKIKQGGNTQ